MLTELKNWRLMMMKALIKNIWVTERIRKEINKIDELAADIRQNGLINPIAVMSVGDDEYRLIAGLRRLRAIESMGLTEIDIRILTPADAEAELMIEISENEQREEFTFSEKMDFARLLEVIEAEKANERMLSGKRVDDPVDDRPQGQGKVRDIIGEKIGMSGRQYSRAKHIAENAPDEIIEELDKGERSINKTYEELRSKEKEEKSSAETADYDIQEDSESNNVEEFPSSTVSPSVSKRKSAKMPDIEALMSKEDKAAVEKIREFHAMTPEEKVYELQCRLKEANARASRAESELSNLKDFHNNAVYHKDGIIDNLKARLTDAEARIKELEEKYCPNGDI